MNTSVKPNVASQQAQTIWSNQRMNSAANSEKPAPSEFSLLLQRLEQTAMYHAEVWLERQHSQDFFGKQHEADRVQQLNDLAAAFQHLNDAYVNTATAQQQQLQAITAQTRSAFLTTFYNALQSNQDQALNLSLFNGLWEAAVNDQNKRQSNSLLHNNTGAANQLILSVITSFLILLIQKLLEWGYFGDVADINDGLTAKKGNMFDELRLQLVMTKNTLQAFAEVLSKQQANATTAALILAQPSEQLNLVRQMLANEPSPVTAFKPAANPGGDTLVS